jgi:lipopolysaccharide export system protein LptC
LLTDTRGDSLSYNSLIRVPTVQPSRQIGADGNRVFRSAARHSRLVRFLRFAIPAIIVIIAAVILMATFFNPFRGLMAAFPIDPRKLSLSGTKLIMELPRVTGFTTDQRPYELTARAAAQDLTKLEILELTEISAKVELRDGQHVDITSINGVYDTKAEVLRLNDHIIVNSTSGYEGRLSEATVYISSGNIVSESPVEVKLPNGLLTANRLEVQDNGAIIKFSGDVEMNLNAEEFRPATQDTASAEAPTQAAPVQTAPTPTHAAPIQTSQRRSMVSP